MNLLAFAFASGVNAQVNPPAKKSPTKASQQTSKNEEANPLALQRRTVAISLLTSLAEIETARSFSADAPRATASLAIAKAVLEKKN